MRNNPQDFRGAFNVIYGLLGAQVRASGGFLFIYPDNPYV